MINMLRTLIDKVDMQEQIGNGSREMESLTRNQKEMPEIKSIVRAMKNVFDGFISRHG